MSTLPSTNEQPIVNEFWPQVLALLRAGVPKPSFDTWLRDTAGALDGGDTVTVTAPNNFVVEMLELHLDNAIRETCAEVAGRSVDVVYRAQLVDFETGQILDAPPKLVELDDEGMAAWLATIGDYRPEWTVRTYGTQRIAKFAARMFGERGKDSPDDYVKHPIRMLVRNLRDGLAVEQAVVHPRILDIGSAR